MKALKSLRESASLKQADLAAKLGVSQPTIAAWENTEAYPRAPLIPLLAKLLGCTIDELFQGEPETDAKDVS